MSVPCNSTHSLGAPAFNDVCVVGTIPSIAMNVLKTCCKSIELPWVDTSDGCYHYCNATSGAVAACFGFDLQNLNTPIDVSMLDANCIGAAALIPNASATASASSITSTSTGGANSGPTASASASAPSASPTAASKAPKRHSLSVETLAVIGLVVFRLLA